MAYTENFISDTNSRERTYPYKDNTIRARRTDPYGFIHFSLERGDVPADLADRVFTTFDEAEKALNAFFERKRLEVENKRPYNKAPLGS